ncbi:MAG: hypothetical protein NVSMB62_29730 [Acidobacteriaceae bacterium]
MSLRTVLPCLGIVCLLPLLAQETKPAEPKYEMAQYVVGFLRKGPNWSAQETAESRQIQDGHMANIRKMAATGKLIVAGPFSDHGDMRGMFIFAVSTVEEARSLAEADPAVKAGRLVLELHPWFAAKGLNVPPPR